MKRILCRIGAWWRGKRPLEAPEASRYGLPEAERYQPPRKAPPAAWMAPRSGWIDTESVAETMERRRRETSAHHEEDCLR